MKSYLGLLGLSLCAAAYGQGSGLAPSALDGLPAPADSDSARGFQRQAGIPLEMQKVCPTSFGTTYIPESDENGWNTVEIGLMVEPRLSALEDVQLYTRYTCLRPLDRP